MFWLCRAKITVRQGTHNAKKGVKVSISDAKNRIAGDIVCPCPPGIPIVMPGEKIGDYEIWALKQYGINEIYVLK